MHPCSRSSSAKAAQVPTDPGKCFPRPLPFLCGVVVVVVVRGAKLTGFLALAFSVVPLLLCCLSAHRVSAFSGFLWPCYGDGESQKALALWLQSFPPFALPCAVVGTRPAGTELQDILLAACLTSGQQVPFSWYIAIILNRSRDRGSPDPLRFELTYAIGKWLQSFAPFALPCAVVGTRPAGTELQDIMLAACLTSGQQVPFSWYIAIILNRSRDRGSPDPLRFELTYAVGKWLQSFPPFALHALWWGQDQPVLSFRT